MTDPAGLELLAERLEKLPEYFRELFSRDWPVPRECSRIVATGLGSSEAHARYLVSLCQRFTSVSARFVPLADFVRRPKFHSESLAVFSQGLSQNTRLVFQSRTQFDRTILFSAASLDALVASGKPDRAELFSALIAEGAEMVRFPLAEEYTILVRVIGPACGFLAARLWAQGLTGQRLPPLDEPSWNQWVSCLCPPVDWFIQNAELLSNGFVILAPGLVVESGYNLVSKFVEGLFWPAPTLLDYLSFAHGPFQQLAARPRPVVLLVGDSPEDRDLADRASQMCRSIRIPTVEIPLPGCPSVAPILAEFLLNPILLALALHLRINQRDWPGKGLDSPLYAYP